MPTFQSEDPNVAAVDGEHSTSGTAVVGMSVHGMGVHGVNDAPGGARIKPNFGCGVWGESTNGYGVWGSSDNASGVVGESTNDVGVNGQSANGVGVLGRSAAGNAVHAVANGRLLFEGGPTVGFGVLGTLTAQPDAVFVLANSGAGVAGVSTTNAGVLGVSATQAGVEGHSTTTGVSGKGSTGVFGTGQIGVNAQGSQFGVQGSYFNPTDLGTAFGFLGGRDPVFREFAGVYGESDGAGVYGNSDANGGTGLHGRGGGDGGFGVRGEVGNGVAAIQGQTFGTGLAARFIGGVHTQGDVEVTGNSKFTGALQVRGDLEVTGDIRLINADCAENFDIGTVDLVEPGTVMVLDDDARLVPSHRAYDKRVAGILSGAGRFQPGLILDNVASEHHRQPIALMGKVYCKVDADDAPVAVGDLLTTSAVEGHAMKARDPARAFGAVIGKALAPLAAGRALIPVLVALQ